MLTAMTPATSELAEPQPSSPADASPVSSFSSFSVFSASSYVPAVAVDSPSSTTDSDGMQATAYSSVSNLENFASSPAVLAPSSDRSDDILESSSIAVEMVTRTADMNLFSSYFNSPSGSGMADQISSTTGRISPSSVQTTHSSASGSGVADEISSTTSGISPSSVQTTHSSTSGSGVADEISSTTSGISPSSVQTTHSSAIGSAAPSSYAQPSPQCCSQSDEYSSMEYSDPISTVAPAVSSVLLHDDVLTTSLIATTQSSQETQQSQSATGLTESAAVSTIDVSTGSQAATTSTLASSSQSTATAPSQCSKTCNCRFVKRGAASERPGSKEMEQMRQSIHRELSMDTSNLSRSVRKRRSATDNRPSAVTVGSAGVVLLAAAFLLICASDILEALYRNEAVRSGGRTQLNLRLTRD